MALVSASPERRVREALELSGMATQFEVVVTAEDVYRGRPDPEGYLYAAQVRAVAGMQAAFFHRSSLGCQCLLLCLGLEPAG